MTFFDLATVYLGSYHIFFHVKILQKIFGETYTRCWIKCIFHTIIFIVIRLRELIFTKNKKKKDILPCTAHLADQLTFSFFPCPACLHNAYNFYWICNASISKNIARLFLFFFSRYFDFDFPLWEKCIIQFCKKKKKKI